MRKRVNFSRKEDELIFDCESDADFNALASKLGRDSSHLKRRKQRIIDGFNAKKHGFFTKKEIALIEACDHVGLDALAVMLGRTVESVKYKKRTLTHKRVIGNFSKFTDYQLELVKNCKWTQLPFFAKQFGTTTDILRNVKSNFSKQKKGKSSVASTKKKTKDDKKQTHYVDVGSLSVDQATKHIKDLNKKFDVAVSSSGTDEAMKLGAVVVINEKNPCCEISASDINELDPLSKEFQDEHQEEVDEDNLGNGKFTLDMLPNDEEEWEEESQELNEKALDKFVKICNAEKQVLQKDSTLDLMVALLNYKKNNGDYSFVDKLARTVFEK